MDQLDPAIREASDYLNGRIPRGVKAVFLNIRSDYPDLSDYILSDLSTNAVNDGVFSVVDRAQLDALRAEMNFQLSGEVDDNSAQEIGKMLGAQTIVSGTVSKVGPLYRLEVKAIEVQTAGIQGQWRKNISSGEIITALTENFVPAAAGGVAVTRSAVPAANNAAADGGQTAAAAETPSPAAPVTYNIGDAGPAGGIIFYDKGNSSGGWRYLEAAPASTDREIQDYPQSIKDLRLFSGIEDRRFGAGKENTLILMGHIERHGGGINTAPWVCDQLVVNGFDDWYQPSVDELLMLYTNIFAKGGSGGFRTEKYWSSTYDRNGYVLTIDFSNGKEDLAHRGERWRVRAIRQF